MATLDSTPYHESRSSAAGRLGAWLKRPVVALGLAGLLTGLVVNSGDPGIDTVRRLQVAHSWWTAEPEVRPEDAAEFGIPGRGGTLRAHYGMGQSIVLLPFDVVATAAVRALRTPGQLAERLRMAGVTIAAFAVIASLLLMAAYAAIRALGFSSETGVIGAVCLQFATGCLPYTQLNAENSLLLLMNLLAIALYADWAIRGRAQSASLGAAASGFSILVRLTECVNAAAFLAAALIVAVVRPGSARDKTDRVVRFVRLTVPILAVFVGIDRVYQWARFGSPYSTYIHLYGQHARELNPLLPPSYPFTHPFWSGFMGPLIAPQRSVVLLEPLFVVALALLLVRWRSLSIPVRTFMTASALTFVTLAAFYGRYYDWSGASAWGDRFVTVPVQAMSLLGAAAIVEGWPQLGPSWRRVAVVACSLGVVVQISAVSFWCNLEESQAIARGRDVYMPWQRWVNIVATVSGRFREWGLDYPGFTPRAILPNFLPFLVEAYVDPRTANVLQACWVMLAVGLAGGVALLARSRWQQHLRNATAGLKDVRPGSPAAAGSATVRNR